MHANKTKQTLIKNLVAFSYVRVMIMLPVSQWVKHCSCPECASPYRVGIESCQDTFVVNEQIRGVLGGQRQRMSMGEMLTLLTPRYYVAMIFLRVGYCKYLYCPATPVT